MNSLNLELITALHGAIEDLEAKKAKGLILTSVGFFFLLINCFCEIDLLLILVIKYGIQCRFGYSGDVQTGR